MNRRFWVYILFLAILFPSEAEAQRWKLQRYEACLGVGTAHPFMDIQNSADGLRSFHLAGTRPNVSFEARYKILNELSVGVDLRYIMFGGLDVEKRMTVNSYTTNAFEHGVNLQYSFISGGKAFGTNGLFNRRGMVNSYNSADVYFFFGAAGILSKSRAFDTNGEIELQDVYFDNNLQYGLVFPVGFGMKYSIDAYWTFGAEIGGRLSLTDDLDGYATPYSNYNDRYILTSFKAIYKIRNDRRGRPKFSRSGR